MKLQARVRATVHGTLMTIVVGFLSVEAMQEYLDMDMEEQMRVTFGQADALLVS